MSGLYSPSGALRVTIVSGDTFTGLFAPDGSLYVAESDGRGVYHACGAYNYTAAEDDTTFGHYAPDGSMYLSFTLGDSGIYAPNGALRADAVFPSDLFALTQPGIFLDGSDNSVMWQDAAGTTPVTALGQSVGLVLDKRLWGGKTYAQVLAEQPEVYPGGELAGNYNASGNTTTPEFWYPRSTSVPTVVGNTLTISDSGGLTTNKTVSNRAYRWRVSWSGLSTGSIELRGNDNALLSSSSAASGTLEVIASFSMSTANTRPYIRFSAAASVTITEISFREVPGNHASQSTSASRPVWQKDENGAIGLQFDGANDFLVTPSIDFSASDKIMVSVGVRHLAGNSNGTIVELSAAANNSNPGSFFLRGSGGGLDNYQWSVSTATNTYAPTATAVAPNSAVLALLSDLGQPRTEHRKDGQFAGGSNGPTGGGNFGNYPLYIGRRAGTSLPFSGFLHQLVIRGGAWPDATELAQLEAYLAAKSKVAID